MSRQDIKDDLELAGLGLFWILFYLAISIPIHARMFNMTCYEWVAHFF